MYRLSRVGQDMMGAALVLFACLGFGQPAFGVATVDKPIADFAVNEDAPPSATIDLQSVFDGNGPFNYAVLSNSNPSVVQAALTNGTRDLTLSYPPDANGVATITVGVTDGDPSSASNTFTVTVNSVNDAPVAVSQAVAGAEDSPLLITLAGTDVDGDPLTFTAGSVTHGTLTGTAPNLTYTPVANYNGSDSFTFTVNDGTVGSAAATVSITVGAANDSPVAVAQAVTTAEDAPLAITLAGTDIDGDPLTFAVGTPSNGTLSGTAPNLTYTPNANFNGSDSFTFTVNDGTASSAAATVSITVTAVNDPPILAALPAPVTSTEDAGTITVNVAGMFNDADLSEGDTLTLSVAGVSNAAMFSPQPTIAGSTLTLPLAPESERTCDHHAARAGFVRRQCRRRCQPHGDTGKRRADLLRRFRIRIRRKTRRRSFWISRRTSAMSTSRRMPTRWRSRLRMTISRWSARPLLVRTSR